MTTPLTLYVPGASVLHRAPPGLKLLGLLVGSSVVVAVDRAALSAAVAVGVAAAVVACGVPVRVLARQARPFIIVAVVLALLQALIGRPEQGATAMARLVAVAMLALAVTLTTRATDLVERFEALLRRMRLRPDRVFRAGLTAGVALRSLDHLGVVAQRVMDARRARGLHRSLRAFAVPTVVGAARFAHGVGEALDARGIARPDPPRPDRAPPASPASGRLPSA